MAKLMTLGKVKPPKWRTFSGKDANRWKKEGSVKSMTSFRRLKANKWWK